MRPIRPLTSLLVLLCLGAALGASCSPSVDAPPDDEETTFGYGGFAQRPEWPGAPGGSDGSGGHAAAQEMPCKPPKGKSLPARGAVTSASAGAKSQVVFTADLFNAFRSHCGGCHVDANLGGFDERVTFENFPTLVTADALEDIKTDDPEKFMPPPVAGGVKWSERKGSDPILELVDLLEKWFDAGSPPDLFFIEPEADASDEERYLMTEERGQELTNIGNCLPDKAWFAKEEDESTALDDKFASMMELPKRLDQTDLTTWDHAELAYRGLVAFAPAYPLFSDNAGKIRHVRVPRGTSIEYDAETREFDIPENTRFYKTFLKDVIDADGKPSYRKMETRLIVSRHDVCDDEGCEPRALYGTYAWNEAETEAILVEDPLRNGEPFRDRVLTYFTDEQAAAAAGSDPAALEAVSRHYAIPGAVRCLQCHQGSPSESFILGFSPVQIHRRPYVEEPDMFAPGEALLGHGVLEEDDPTEDELGQMQRMIDLGVVTGIDDPDSLSGLRDLGAEPPRNGYELQAQGYMLGNCSNCHNPRGFPSQKHPELRPLLNFYPSKDGGGIYQFPLERTSPRVFRAKAPDPYYDTNDELGMAFPLQVELPYITPSPYDLPNQGGEGGYGKCIPAYYSESGIHCVEAPWRSLIFRNVDTPFTYSEDGAIFPHMPRHGTGFDCRAPRIVGDWMLSIPSNVDPRIAEMRVVFDPTINKNVTIPIPFTEDKSPLPQPRKEVPSSIAQYDAALKEAKDRVSRFDASERYARCADQSDIQDPEVLAGLTLVPRDNNPITFPDVAFLGWYDEVPDRAHWVVLDTTDVPGDWTPRRSDWADILMGEDPDKVAALDPAEKVVVDTLASADISMDETFREYALEPVPFGWWSDPDGACSDVLGDEPTLQTLPDDEVPVWGLPWAEGGEVGKKPLYYSSPGAAVFQQICRNCHGPRGDGDSALAGTISEITGGGVRVANLEAGLFGPADDPGHGRLLAFSEAAGDAGLDPNDLALRYLLWMALGGTEVDIPSIALQFVAQARVLGEFRYQNTEKPSGNMLNSALMLCNGALNSSPSHHLLTGRTSVRSLDVLIPVNGDAELWMKLCSFGRGAPVRMLTQKWTGAGVDLAQTFALEKPGNGLSSFVDPEVYGDSPVMTRLGVVNGVPYDASDAWCVVKPSGAEDLAAADAFLSAPENLFNGQQVPYCPDGIVPMTLDEVDGWVRLGAMNAGKAVFVYLDAVAKGTISPQLGYEECDKLSQ